VVTLSSDSRPIIGRGPPLGAGLFFLGIVSVVVMVLDHRGGYLETARLWMSAAANPIYAVVQTPAQVWNWLTGSFAEDPGWQIYTADTVENYEVGIKGTLGPLRYDVSAFQVDWHDPQLNTATTNWGFFAVINGDEAESKGVELQHRTIGANLDALAKAAALDVERDVLVSWLPLYHDMGLVGLLTTPMTNGADLVLGAPQDFLAAHGRCLHLISAFGGTLR
jgi:acyl-CoA synthetase (AMP-forming)/AMP-acid ligase II